MIRLIQNELMKLTHKVNTWVMIAILLISVLSLGVFKIYTQNESDKQADAWKEELRAEIMTNEEFIANNGEDSIARSIIEENNYRLNNNLPPQESLPDSVWTFLSDSQTLIQLVGLFVIVTAATIVSTEFKNGTISHLLIRPPSRIAILLSKYATIIIYSIFLMFFLFALTFIIGVTVFGFDGNFVHLIYKNGELHEQSIVNNILVVYTANWIDIVVISSLAFGLSSIFNNDSLPIALSLFLYILGSAITSVVAAFFDWPKYLFLTNSLEQYFTTQGPPIDNMTIEFSIIILLLYWILFMTFSIIIFNRKEV
ncbi:ABC transporter permease [Halobacillus sp. A5]|uniref:ABC transporter permease n=1 Tax=Halobacillus sp. A5 TaxID=2880263 RepID=UPI0020A65FF4|nr:ABC transporter permease [Halobacillus sp. A5]MCP3027033.1 ABC transporter permease [Halobacillus sp. A5]